MEKIINVHDFAVKWMDKFNNEKTEYNELVDSGIADECIALGFQMDCGDAFSKMYGSAASDYKELGKVIDQITDIEILGSAIYSQWRYFNHWAYSGVEILEFENRMWFTLALRRLAELAEK